MASLSLREKHKNLTRQLIYDSALKLCNDLGYEKTTVEKITEAAGVAKGTFFNYFPSKDALFANYYKELTLNVLDESYSTEFKNARDAVIHLTVQLGNLVLDQPMLFKSLGKNRLLSGELSNEEQNLDRSLFDYCEKHVKKGCDNHELDETLNIKVFVELIIASLTATGHEWRLAGGDYPIDEKLRERINFLFDLVSK